MVNIQEQHTKTVNESPHNKSINKLLVNQHILVKNICNLRRQSKIEMCGQKITRG